MESSKRVPIKVGPAKIVIFGVFPIPLGDKPPRFWAPAAEQFEIQYQICKARTLSIDISYRNIGRDSIDWVIIGSLTPSDVKHLETPIPDA